MAAQKDKGDKGENTKGKASRSKPPETAPDDVDGGWFDDDEEPTTLKAPKKAAEAPKPSPKSSKPVAATNAAAPSHGRSPTRLARARPASRAREGEDDPGSDRMARADGRQRRASDRRPRAAWSTADPRSTAAAARCRRGPGHKVIETSEQSFVEADLEVWRETACEDSDEASYEAVREINAPSSQAVSR